MTLWYAWMLTGWIQSPAVRDNRRPSQPPLGRMKTLTLSRDRWLVLETAPRLPPITEPVSLYGVMLARASRSALAIATDPIHADRKALVEGLDPACRRTLTAHLEPLL